MMRAVIVALVLVWQAATVRAADAPYVTTPDVVVETMLKIADVSADDFLIDLGSGDGRIPIAAAKTRNARGQGFEIDASLVSFARREAQRQGVAGRVSFVTDDVFLSDFSRATVLTVYMGASMNQRLRPAIFKLRPGTRVVSHDFDMGNWKPDQQITIPVPGKSYGPPRSDILMWIIPADFSGVWRWLSDDKQAYEATLEQTFQRVEGKGTVTLRPAAIGKPEVRGDSIRFTMASGGVQREFRGRINGDTITGTAVTIGASQDESPWRATRVTRGKLNIEADMQTFGTGISGKE